MHPVPAQALVEQYKHAAHESSLQAASALTLADNLKTSAEHSTQQIQALESQLHDSHAQVSFLTARINLLESQTNPGSTAETHHSPPSSTTPDHGSAVQLSISVDDEGAVRTSMSEVMQIDEPPAGQAHTAHMSDTASNSNSRPLTPLSDTPSGLSQTLGHLSAHMRTNTADSNFEDWEAQVRLCVTGAGVWGGWGDRGERRGVVLQACMGGYLHI